MINKINYDDVLRLIKRRFLALVQKWLVFSDSIFRYLGYGLALSGYFIANTEHRVFKTCFFGNEYKAVAEVVAIDTENNTVTFTTECFDHEGNKIISSEAVVKPIPAKLKEKN